MLYSTFFTCRRWWLCARIRSSKPFVNAWYLMQAGQPKMVAGTGDAPWVASRLDGYADFTEECSPIGILNEPYKVLLLHES